MSSRGLSAGFLRYKAAWVSAFLALAANSGPAFAQNIVDIACDGTPKRFALCQDGNTCQTNLSQIASAIGPVSAANSGQDIVNFTGISNGLSAHVVYKIDAPIVSIPKPGNPNAPPTYFIQANPARGTIKEKSTNTQIASFSVATGALPTPPSINVPSTGQFTITNNGGTNDVRHQIDLLQPNSPDLPSDERGTYDFNLIRYEATCTPIPKASVSIKKKTVDGFGTFSFSVTGPTAVSDFQLQTTTANTTTDDNNDKDLTDLAPGTYTFVETSLDSTWLLTGLTCTGTGASIEPGTTKITFAPGANAICTFENTKRNDEKGTIVVKKVASGGTSQSAFSFTTANLDPNGFQLASAGEQVFPNVDSNPTNPYTITETPADGWSTAVACTGDGDYSAAGNTATVNSVGAGKTVTCTFTNTRDTGTLNITKQTIGGNGTFSFLVAGQYGFSLPGGATKTFASLPTGNYTITETNLPDGWVLQNISGCGTRSGNSVTVNLTTAGATCTFVNFKEKDERMEEETKRFIHRRVDNLLTHGPDRARMLRRLQEGQQESLKDGPSDAIPPLKFAGRSGAAGSAAGAAFGLGSPLAASQANGPITSFAANGAPLGLGIHRTESEFEQSQRKSTGNPFFDAVAAQASQMATNSSGFKFSSSLSELRAMAKQHEEQSQKKKIEAAGLNYSGVAITTPRMEPKPGFDFWVEGHISRYNDGLGGVNREGHFRILYAGADYIIKPGLLIGALVQIDDTEEKLSQPGETGSIDGTGWMAGPYLGWRILPNLFFDMRGAWGTSNNSIALNDGVARTGEFKTERWLATANLTGNEVIGAWRLSPQIGIAYGHESYDTYKNSLGQTIDGGEANIGRVTGKMEVGYRIRAADGMRVEPHLGITGIWNFDTDKLVINGATVSSNENRARLEGGVIVTTTSGWSVRAAANYDGIGASTFESYGGSLWLNFPLN